MILKVKETKTKDKPRRRIILNLLRDKKVFNFQKGHGSFLTIDLGKKTISRKNGKKIEFNEFSLWIYMCNWQIRHQYTKKPYFSSSSISENDNVLLNSEFKNSSVKSFKLTSKGLHLIFSNFLEIILSESVDTDGDDWLIISKNNKVFASFNNNKKFYFES